MIGTIVNVLAVLIGGTIGLIFKKAISDKLADAIMKGLGLCVLYIGVKGTMTGESVIIDIFAIVIGVTIGELLDFDGKLNQLGDGIESKFKGKNGKISITEGFVTASLLFCVGSMTILGALESGLSKNYDMLFTKSILDFVSAMIFASSLGIGVLFSAIFIFVYQGGITMLASWLAPSLNDKIVAEMTCVGSLIIIGLALNMLGITKLKVINYVPAIFLPIVLCALPIPDLTNILGWLKNFL